MNLNYPSVETLQGILLGCGRYANMGMFDTIEQMFAYLIDNSKHYHLQILNANLRATYSYRANVNNWNDLLDVFYLEVTNRGEDPAIWLYGSLLDLVRIPDTDLDHA